MYERVSHVRAGHAMSDKPDPSAKQPSQARASYWINMLITTQGFNPVHRLSVGALALLVVVHGLVVHSVLVSGDMLQAALTQ
jgi:hypothetical protein